MNNTKNIDVIAPSLGRRFSGINASMHAVIPEQKKLVNIVGLGFNLDPEKIPTISFKKILFGCWRDKWRIWHARRNIDMLAGIILRYVFRYKLILIFTSASQRKHSWLTKFYYHKMSGVIATTNSGGKFLECSYDVVYHGINTSRFFPSEDYTSTKRIGFVNRIRKQKGAEDFIDALIQILPKYPNWIAELIGETTQQHKEFEKDLKSRLKKAGLEDRVIFKGLVEYNKTPDFYRDCEIVVCLSHVEGFGLPCFEAMASRCAVVATKTGVWKEVIDSGKNGYLVDIKSPNQIADKLDILMSNEQLRRDIAQKGYELVTSKYDIKNEVEGIQKVYDKVLAGKNS